MLRLSVQVGLYHHNDIRLALDTVQRVRVLAEVLAESTTDDHKVEAVAVVP